jgi:hypothetical protein
MKTCAACVQAAFNLLAFTKKLRSFAVGVRTRATGSVK